MGQESTNISKKTLSRILLTIHFVVTLIIACFFNSPYNAIEVLGTIAEVAGFSIIVIISYICLSYRKIQKIGTWVSIAFQIMACSGRYFSVLMSVTDNYYVLGILCGIVSNVFYIFSMLLLLDLESSKNASADTKSFSPAQSIESSETNTISFCPNCGSKITSSEHKFCLHCGKELERMITNDTLKKPLSLSQENKSSNQKTCIDFSVIGVSEQEAIRKKLRNISIPNNQTILAIGKIEFKGFSLIPWIITITAWIIELLLLILSYDDGRRPAIVSEDGKLLFSTLGSYSHSLLGIEFASESKRSGEITYFFPEIFSIVFIFIVLLSIPLFVMLLIKKHILDAELVLTNIGIYSGKDIKANMIALDKIQSIEYKSCPFFRTANKISIITILGKTSNFYGLSNAPEFVQQAIQKYKSIKNIA